MVRSGHSHAPSGPEGEKRLSRSLTGPRVTALTFTWGHGFWRHSLDPNVRWSFHIHDIQMHDIREIPVLPVGP